jgi:hypothetical protein
MDKAIFSYWFREIFIDSVREKQRWKTGFRGKCLLILNNAASHHNLSELNDIDPFVKVMSPPRSIATFIQPMNCGIITCVKRKYRIELSKAITPLPMYNEENEMTNRYKALNMWDCCRFVDDAWSLVDREILMKSWDTRLMLRIIWFKEITDWWNPDIFKALELLKTLPGCNHCKDTDVLNWFHMDTAPALIMRMCTEEILLQFENNTLGQVITDITDEQAGPSYS